MFWNLGNCQNENLVAALAYQYDVDVLMLAECKIPPNRLLVALNQRSKILYDYAMSDGCDKIEIFVRFHRQSFKPQLETSRLTIRHLTLPNVTDILVAVVHSPSKLHWSESSQTAEANVLADRIRKAESLVGHSRTIVVGDFNMNPFEAGMVNANGMHGVMTRQIALNKSRTVQEVDYPYFYNPMWSIMGDASRGQPGTYYYSGAQHTAYFWNMFDQVLLRPDMLGYFKNEDMSIIDSLENISLLTANGYPN